MTQNGLASYRKQLSEEGLKGLDQAVTRSPLDSPVIQHVQCAAAKIPERPIERFIRVRLQQNRGVFENLSKPLESSLTGPAGIVQPD
jgi:ribosomal protein S12